MPLHKETKPNQIYLSIYLSIPSLFLFIYFWVESPGVIAKVLNCDIAVSKFEIQSCNYVRFWENNETSYFPVIGQIVKLLYHRQGIALALNYPRRLICN